MSKNNLPDNSSKYWKRTGDKVFSNAPFPKDISEGQLLTNVYTVPEYEAIRNAEIKFTIKIIAPPKHIHAAVLFRKNGDNYLGAGLGGWNSEFSLCVGSKNRISGWLIGRESSIQLNKKYEFELRFQSGYITKFKCNNENLITQNLSIRDSLGSNLAKGNIGLYAWDQTESEISLSVEELPNKCFVITNINSHTDARREMLSNILRKNNIQCELIDARDLTRENPLMLKIKEGILSSDFVISDFGFQEPRPNVWYETGIAHSLGIPTIHIGPKEKEFEKIVPSDLRAQFFVLEEELKLKLPETAKVILDNHSGVYNYLD